MFRGIVLAAGFTVAMAAHAADYDTGVAAFDQGDFARALAELRPLTERGHAGAEFMLGAMYFYGKGVPGDPGTAAVWFAKAARQGNPSAQLAFGSLHIRGIGVKQDLVKAHMWLSLAAANSNLPGVAQQAALLREDAARLMTPEERDAARRLAQGWRPVKAGFTRGN